MELMISLGEYVIPRLSRAEFKTEVEQKKKIDFSKWSITDLETLVNL